MSQLLSAYVCVFLLVIHPALCGAAVMVQLVGAPEEMVKEDLSDPYVQAAAKFAVLGINNLSKGKKVRVLVDVVEGTTQVVAGLRYNLVLEVGESEYCEKDDDIPLETIPSLEECPVSNPDTIQMWYADVWMKPVYPLQFELLSLQSEDGRDLTEESRSRSKSDNSKS